MIQGAGKFSKLCNLIAYIRRLLYWTLPLFILYLVFQRTDFAQLAEVVANADLAIVIIGILLIIFVIATGGLRWYMLFHLFDCALLPLSKSISEYWKSLAIGVLIPGSLGSDAYRVMFLGRRDGYYLRSAFVIGVEKLAALFCCALLIGALYPCLAPNQLPNVVSQIINILYIVIIFGVFLTLAFILVRKQVWVRSLADFINSRLESLARRIATLSPTPPAAEEKSPRAAVSLMIFACSPKVLLPTLGLSISILFISAIQTQFFFQALGYEISFIVNLFVTPLLFLLFTLPISFGSIGIREGAYVLLYGAFGVPAEIALVVSFCGLLSLLLSYAIGGSLFYLSKDNKDVNSIKMMATKTDK